MLSATSNRTFNPEWFNLVGDGAMPYAIPKHEFQDQVRKAFADIEAQGKKNYEDLTNRVQSGGAKTKLTSEQQDYLRANFDPRSMSKTDYQAFIDKLCEYGVLDEADKPYVSYGIAGCDLDMTPLTAFNGRAYLEAANKYNPRGYTPSFSSSGGDVLSWARYLASEEIWCDNRFQLKPESILFGRIRDALEAIAA